MGRGRSKPAMLPGRKLEGWTMPTVKEIEPPEPILAAALDSSDIGIM